MSESIFENITDGLAFDVLEQSSSSLAHICLLHSAVGSFPRCVCEPFLILASTWSVFCMCFFAFHYTALSLTDSFKGNVLAAVNTDWPGHPLQDLVLLWLLISSALLLPSVSYCHSQHQGGSQLYFLSFGNLLSNKLGTRRFLTLLSFPAFIRNFTSQHPYPLHGKPQQATCHPKWGGVRYWKEVGTALCSFIVPSPEKVKMVLLKILCIFFYSIKNRNFYLYCMWM